MVRIFLETLFSKGYTDYMLLHYYSTYWYTLSTLRVDQIMRRWPWLENMMIGTWWFIHNEFEWWLQKNNWQNITPLTDESLCSPSALPCSATCRSTRDGITGEYIVTNLLCEMLRIRISHPLLCDIYILLVQDIWLHTPVNLLWLIVK